MPAPISVLASSLPLIIKSFTPSITPWSFVIAESVIVRSFPPPATFFNSTPSPVKTTDEPRVVLPSIMRAP